MPPRLSAPTSSATSTLRPMPSRVGERVAEWLGNARREARPQRRIAVPVGLAGDIRRTTSRQRHLSRRRQRQPTARRVSKGKRRILGRGHRQPQRNLCQPQTGRIGGASQRRRDSDGQVPSGVPHQAHDALTPTRSPQSAKTVMGWAPHRT